MRYVRKPTMRGYIEDDTYPAQTPMLPSLHVEGAAEVDTGLVWADGSTIYRVSPPIGFGRNDEWY